MIKVSFSPIYKYSLPPGHRFPMVKYELIPQQLLREGTISENQFFNPDPISFDELVLTHTEEYLHQLHDLPLPRKKERAIGFPVREDLIHRGKHIAGGTLQCARYAMSEGVALNVAGGTHHAFADRGEGFCVFNDFAIAANILLQNEEVQQILIIDLDVHQGNGTAEIFQDDERVFTWSMHGEKNYPLRKTKSDLDIGMPDGCDDAFYLDTLENRLVPTISLVQPDLIMYLSGVDVLASDKLGRLGMTREGCKKRDEMVLSTCRDLQIPVTVSMGGGYSEKLADIVEAHANTFRVAQALFDNE